MQIQQRFRKGPTFHTEKEKFFEIPGDLLE